jgi:hypothetical protein
MFIALSLFVMFPRISGVYPYDEEAVRRPTARQQINRFGPTDSVAGWVLEQLRCGHDTHLLPVQRTCGSETLTDMSWNPDNREWVQGGRIRPSSPTSLRIQGCD